MTLAPSFVSSFVAATTTGGWAWWEEGGYIFFEVENGKFSKLGSDPTRYWEDAPNNTPEEDRELREYLTKACGVITDHFGRDKLEIEKISSPRNCSVTFIWRP